MNNKAGVFWRRTGPLLLMAAPYVHAQSATESFYLQASRAVIRLQHHQDIRSAGERESNSLDQTPEDGTAFFVHTPDALYVVTARHLTRQGYTLHALVPTREKSSGRTVVLELKLPKERWVSLPEQKNDATHAVDVAAMKIPPMRDYDVVAFGYCPGSCPEGEYDQLGGRDPEEPPDHVVIFGFPVLAGGLGLKLKETRPMGRFGIVSSELKSRSLKCSLQTNPVAGNRNTQSQELL